MSIIRAPVCLFVSSSQRIFILTHLTGQFLSIDLLLAHVSNQSTSRPSSFVAVAAVVVFVVVVVVVPVVVVVVAVVVVAVVVTLLLTIIIIMFTVITSTDIVVLWCIQRCWY